MNTILCKWRDIYFSANLKYDRIVLCMIFRFREALTNVHSRHVIEDVLLVYAKHFQISKLYL